MKKFFHSEVDDIDSLKEFLRRDWQLFDCRVDGSACHKVDHSAVRTYFDETMRLWGQHPENYLLAVRNSVPESTSLATIMDALKHSEIGDIVALIGYNDGGLLSLSAITLPPQQGARTASWWSGSFAC
ncbi:hypothetical protein [Rhizobium sullae]|uniref:hypothetical protein n=1 Tax=Rhizobium sullae TaxID=50338 RepID=UPI00104AC250|nr:hypothetical protein [Rhizobium sullae]